jgi:hypothetical protein
VPPSATSKFKGYAECEDNLLNSVLMNKSIEANIAGAIEDCKQGK